MVHLVFHERFGTFKPLWLNEGLAQYLSGQEKPPVEVSAQDVIDLFDEKGFGQDKRAYAKSLVLVKRLIEPSEQ